MKKLVSLFIVVSLLLGVVAFAEDNVVTITIPPMSEDQGSAPIDSSQIDNDKILSYVTKDDGTVVITMTREAHDELMVDLEQQFQSSLNDVVANCEAIKSIEPNEDYTQMDILIDTSAPDAMLFSFQLIACIVVLSYYQVFNGVSSEDIHYTFNFFDEATGETSTFDSLTNDPSELFPSFEQ